MPKSIIISNGGVSAVSNSGGGRINRRNKNNGKRFKTKYRVLIFLLVLVLFAVFIMRYAAVTMRPIIVSMAEAHARSIGAKVVSEAINEEVEANNITYDDLISFEKGEAGQITALKTNILLVNRIKASLSVAVLNKLSNMKDLNLYIPVGNLVNGEFFSGRGPKLEIILIPVGSVTTNITNVFTSAGINQTRHQIMLEVNVTVSVIMPFSVESTDISTSIPIAETIIVGDVPQMFMEMDSNAAKSEISKIIDNAK